jgi:hypothetical protein
MFTNICSKIRNLTVIALLLGTAASAGGQGWAMGAAPPAGYHVKNFSACEVHRNAYNTYVAFYNNATTRQEREQWRQKIEEERRNMQRNGC